LLTEFGLEHPIAFAQVALKWNSGPTPGGARRGARSTTNRNSLFVSSLILPALNPEQVVFQQQVVRSFARIQAGHPCFERGWDTTIGRARATSGFEMTISLRIPAGT
jgi:hypothetical protein